MRHIHRPLCLNTGHTFPSIVEVFRAEGNQKGEFLRYETYKGVPCDEHGVELGVINFKKRGGKS